MSSPPDPPSPAELNELLRPLAAQLIWWQPADVSLRNPDRVIAQVLDLGTFEAGQRLREVLGDGRLAQVLQRAEAGWFSPRSWNYWHQKLGLACSGAVPPLPRRHFGDRDENDHAAVESPDPHLQILPEPQRRPRPCMARGFQSVNA